MKFKTQTAELAAALATAARAIQPRAVRPILEGVLIEAKEGGVTLTATDGSMTIRTDAAAWVDEEGKTVVQGQLLTDLVRKLPGAEASIETDGNVLRVQSGKSRSRLSAMSADEFPDAGTFAAAHKLTVPCAELRRMIDGVAFSVATDESRQALTGVRMEAKDGRLTLVTLDGFRLSMTVTDAACEDFTLLVPGKSMGELGKILPGDDTPCEISASEKQFATTFGGTLFRTVPLNVPYPDIDKIVPKTFATEMLVSRKEMIGAIDRAGLMARNSHNNLIRMQAEDGRCALSSRAEIGEVADDVDAEVAGNGLAISFNAKYLTDVFRVIGADEAVVKMTTPTGPAVIVPKGDDRAMYLVLPVRTA